jgi:hypothetical protein
MVLLYDPTGMQILLGVPCQHTDASMPCTGLAASPRPGKPKRASLNSVGGVPRGMGMLRSSRVTRPRGRTAAPSRDGWTSSLGRSHADPSNLIRNLEPYPTPPSPINRGFRVCTQRADGPYTLDLREYTRTPHPFVWPQPLNHRPHTSNLKLGTPTHLPNAENSNT